MNSFLQQFDEQVARRLAAETRDAAVQRALRTELLSGIPPQQRGAFQNTTIEIMSDADFSAFTRSGKANAVTIIDNGRPRILMRDGAPPGVLREEGIHLQQIADADLGRLARRLDEGRLSNWDDLPLGEKLDLYSIKLELEIDAQIKLIRGLEADIGASQGRPNLNALKQQKADVERALGNLRRRAREVQDLGPRDRIAMSRGLRDPPDYLDQPPRLFSKADDTAQPTEIDIARSRTEGEFVEDSPLSNKVGTDERIRIKKIGVEPSQVELEIDPTNPITLKQNGEIITLQLVDGKIKKIVPEKGAEDISPGTTFRDDDGRLHDFTVGRGRTVTIDRHYRIVEIVGPDGQPKASRGEALSVSHKTLETLGWRKRGSDIARSGREAELSSERFSAQLTAKAEHPVIGHFMVQRSNGTGFDGIEIRRREDGSVFLAVVEVKHKEGKKHAPIETFTAVIDSIPILMRNGDIRHATGNVENNLNDLNTALTPTDADIALAHNRIAQRQLEADADYASSTLPGGGREWDLDANLDNLERMLNDADDWRFHSDADPDIPDQQTIDLELNNIMAEKLGISVDAYIGARQALESGQLELLIRHTKSTRIGDTGSNNLLDRLADVWERLTAPFISRRTPLVEEIPDQLMNESRAAYKALDQMRDQGMDLSDSLQFSGITEAPFLDSQGRPFSIRQLNPGDVADLTGGPPVTQGLADQLRSQVALPDGSPTHPLIVVDLSDCTGNREIIENRIRSALGDHELDQEALDRLIFVHQRN